MVFLIIVALFFEHGDLTLILRDAALAAGGSDYGEYGQ